MAQYSVKNNGDSAFTFPAPFSVVLQPGASITLDGTPENFLSCCKIPPQPWVTITIETRDGPTSGDGFIDAMDASLQAGENLPKIITGQASFAAAAATATVSIGAAYNDKRVFPVWAQLDNGDATKVIGAVAGGTLTLTLDAVPGTGKTALVNWLLDGR